MFSVVIQPKCSSRQKLSLCLCFVTENLKMTIMKVTGNPNTGFCFP